MSDFMLPIVAARWGRVAASPLGSGSEREDEEYPTEAFGLSFGWRWDVLGTFGHEMH